MGFVIQKTSPKIEFYSSKTNLPYQVFAKDNESQQSGQNLQSYSFQKSINNIAGTFQIVVKEDVDGFSNSNSFYNNVNTLDIVTISEGNDDIDFIGVVTTISYAGQANGFQKLINISGRSIEFLFEYLNISLDATAMAWTQGETNITVANLNVKFAVKEYTSKEDPGKETGAVSVKGALNTLFNSFCDVARQKVPNLANTKIIDIINFWYGGSIFECDPEMKFKYPISSNLFTDGTINILSYIRNLLPSNIYEIYGIVKSGRPKIMVRQVPFNPEDWVKLPYLYIDSDFLTQFTFTKSIEEVYTVFYSYIEGSQISPAFQEALNAIQNGLNMENSGAAWNKEKIARYGYKPLKCNFIGFHTPVATEMPDSFKKNIKKLNQDICNWYGDLDTMLDATISVVKDSSRKRLKEGNGDIGERLIFNGGEFYITGNEHSWQYGQSIKVTYHCERGGNYTAGKYSELKNITRPYGELK